MERAADHPHRPRRRWPNPTFHHSAAVRLNHTTPDSTPYSSGWFGRGFMGGLFGGLLGAGLFGMLFGGGFFGGIGGFGSLFGLLLQFAVIFFVARWAFRRFGPRPAYATAPAGDWSSDQGDGGGGHRYDAPSGHGTGRARSGSATIRRRPR